MKTKDNSSFKKLKDDPSFKKQKITQVKKDCEKQRHLLSYKN